MELLFLKKFFKGVKLPSLSISLEDGRGVFVLRGKRGIKNYLIENFNYDIVKLRNGEWEIDSEEKVMNTLKKLKSQNFKETDTCVLLIPDFLANFFIFSFENLPKNKMDAENLIRWRVEKQFPSKGEIILRYYLFKQNKEIKVLTVSIPKPIIQQYLSIMENTGIKTSFISVPILPLYNFIRNISNSKNGVIIINRLSKGTSFLGFTSSSFLIFRNKIGNLAKEEVIEEAISTMKWMQEKENVKTDEIWIRDISDEMWDELEKPFLPISSLERRIRDIKFLAPHLGIPEWTE